MKKWLIASLLLNVLLISSWFYIRYSWFPELMERGRQGMSGALTGQFEASRELNGTGGFVARAELHVAHAFAGSLQEVLRVVEQRAEEEADVRVRGEDVHVGESCIAAAGGRGAVVHHFADVVPEAAHEIEPREHQRGEVRRLLFEPVVDLGSVPHTAVESQESDRCFLHG